MKISNELKDMLQTINPEIRTEQYCETAHLVDDLGLDSIQLMVLTLEIENKYQIDILKLSSEGQINLMSIRTVKEILLLIRKFSGQPN